MKNFPLILFALILILSSCGNLSGNGNAANQNPDSLANAQLTKGVSIKEKQRFHTQAERSLDSMQRLIDAKDREMKKQSNDVAKKNWQNKRDSLRRILDHANRTLNNQSYKSDDEWKSIEKTVSIDIESVKSGLKRE